MYIISCTICRFRIYSLSGYECGTNFIVAIRSLILTHRELLFQTTNIYYQILKPVFERHIKEDSVSYDKRLRKIKKAGKGKNKDS